MTGDSVSCVSVVTGDSVSCFSVVTGDSVSCVSVVTGDSVSCFSVWDSPGTWPMTCSSTSCLPSSLYHCTSEYIFLLMY